MIECFQIDAFTEHAFTGNPAVVCLLPEEREAAWMQAVAAEMNLSETAFCRRRDDGSFDLRWFTPTVEVPLCGHATLATAHALWESGTLRPDEAAVFHTRSGRLEATRSGSKVALDFPVIDVAETAAPAGLEQVLGARVLATFEVVGGALEAGTLVAELADEDTVADLHPDHARLAALGAPAVIVTARGTGTDFVSRFFGPGVGIAEDPVTGAAHCALGPLWSRRLGRDQLQAAQLSARGGRMGVEVRGDRVVLTGHAVTVLRGTLLS